MNLARRIDDALKALDAAVPLFEVLELVNIVNDGVQSRLLGIAEGKGSQIVDNANALHSEFASLSSTIREISARNLFRVVETLSDHLSTSLVEGAYNPKHVQRLLSELDTFAETYNTYVAHQRGVNAVPLLYEAHRVRNSLSSLRAFLEYVQSNLSEPLITADDEAEFSLVLLNISGVKDFADRLIALQDLYDELCNVLGVITASHPLRIRKIESGSLWTWLVGNIKTIDLMIWLIKGSARFAHRNYTTEGKIAAIPTKMESLNSILDFSNRLKENGLDVSAIEDSLAKNAFTIVDNLNKIVSQQPAIEVNGELISVEGEVQKALLERSEARRLGYSPSKESKANVDPANNDQA